MTVILRYKDLYYCAPKNGLKKSQINAVGRRSYFVKDKMSSLCTQNSMIAIKQHPWFVFSDLTK